MNDDEPFGDDFRVPSPKGKRKPWDIVSESLSVTAIEEIIQKEAEHIMSITGVDVRFIFLSLLEPAYRRRIQLDTAMLLLRYMKWNKERLIEKYMDDPTALNEAAGVTVQPTTSPPASPPSPRPPQYSSRRVTRSSKPESTPVPQVAPEEPFSCPICCTEEPSNTLSMKCGHTFCSDCWSMYVTSKIREEGECNFTCMSTDCTLTVPDSFVKEVSNSSTFQRFHELVVRHYVAHQSQLKYCPAPSCIYAVKSQASTSKASLKKIAPIVRCQENHAFCFGCPIDSDHRPLVCAVSKLWLKKCQDDSETANWIKSNTKECSKCQSTIEKNGGCKCVQEFSLV